MKRFAAVLIAALVLALVGCETEGDRRVKYEFTKMDFEKCQKHFHVDYESAKTDRQWQEFLKAHPNYDPAYGTMPENVYNDCMATSVD